jgi:ribonuclease P protein component
MAENSYRPKTKVNSQRFITNQIFLIVNQNKENKLKKSVIYYRIGKKNVPKAVDRNTLKRRFREIMREYKDKLPIGLTLSIGITGNITTKPFSELKNDLTKLLNQANLI